MPSFGERLRREREKRKVTLDEISISTKIGTRMLQALEDEKFDQLPGGIFNKGFVRAYARHLGLDEEQAVADYLEAVGEASAAQVPQPSPEVRIVPAREPESASPRRELPWGLLAAALLVLALALSLWSYFKRERSEPARPPASHAPVAAPAAAQPSSSTPPSSAPPVEEPSASSQISTASQVSAIPDATPPASASPGFSVTLKATDDSWLSVTADGQTITPDDLLAGGAERNLRANREIVVKVGNAGGVEFYFNGTKLPRQGDDGEVRTLTFHPDGLVPPPLAKPRQ